MSCGVSSCSVLPAGLQSGGGCGCTSGRNASASGANRGLFGGLVGGGKAYCATRRNLKMLRKYKRGVSIGFTGRSSLRAKGLLPRISQGYKGKYVLGPKYSGTRRNRVLRRQTKKCKRI